MRNVLVVLVLSCIGLSCGFIAPSGIREIIADLSKNENTIENSDSKPRNMIKSKTYNASSVNITSDLLNDSVKIHNNPSNNSLDNDLYENSGKEAAIKERSFIYINQRAKKPYLKSVFEMPKTNFDEKKIKPYVISDPVLDDISRHFLSKNLENKFFHTHVGQSNQNNYQSNINNFIKYYIDEDRRHQIEKTSNKNGKSLEAIKAPLARLKTNEKDFISMENSLFNFTIGRKLLADIQESLSSKHDIKSKKYGQLENTNINYEETVTENIENDNLDQIVNKVMRSQILGRKSNRIDHKGFHFCRDCDKKGKEQSFNRLQFESDCNCGRKTLIKIIEDDIAN